MIKPVQPAQAKNEGHGSSAGASASPFNFTLISASHPLAGQHGINVPINVIRNITKIAQIFISAKLYENIRPCLPMDAIVVSILENMDRKPNLQSTSCLLTKSMISARYTYPLTLVTYPFSTAMPDYNFYNRYILIILW